MGCPQCGSVDAYSCPIAFERGTSPGTSSGSQTYSASGEGGWVRGTGVHGGSTTSQTGFAQRAAPPSHGLDEGPMIIFLGAAVAVVGTFWGGAALYGIGALFALWGVGHLIYRVVTLPDWFKRKAEWRRSWICGRCGTVFLPGGE